MSNILAIESSCDDTAAAILINDTIASNVSATQMVHTNFGGVVPELASRQHQLHIAKVVDEALQKANTQKKDMDAIAVTQGPGLMGSLLVGVSFAKALALGLNLPLIGINHLEAHFAAHFIKKPWPTFPFLCLLVSGGHTQIIKLSSPTDYQIIGKTTDDAAGEAFDKAAKMLGLPYPGGPLIDKYGHTGNYKAFSFPLPYVPGYDYSFSGLKTAFLYFLRDNIKTNPEFISQNLNDICASIQYRIVTYLLKQFIAAANKHRIKSIGICGGVAANSLLRKMILEVALENKWEAHIPDFEYCTDNAAMVAMAARFKYDKKEFSSLDMKPFSS